MKLRLSLGTLVSVASVTLAVYMSGGTVSPGLLAVASAFVILVPLGAGLAGFGFGGIVSSFRTALAGYAGIGSEASGTEPGGPEREQALRQAAAVFGLLRKATAGAAFLGFLMVQIMMMYDLQTKEDIRLYLSFSFVPALVGLVVVACVYVPLEYSLRTQAVADGAPLVGGTRRDRPARPGLRLLSGAAFSLAVILGCFFLILARGRLYPFFNPPSVVVMLFFPLGNLLAGPGPGGLARAFAALGGRGADGSSSRARRRAAEAFAYLCRSILLSGGVAFLTGVVYFLQGLNDRMRYGPTMALALVGVFQAILLLLCVGLPLKAAADAAIAERGTLAGL